LAIPGKGLLFPALERWDEGEWDDFSKDQTVAAFPYKLRFTKGMERTPVYYSPHPAFSLRNRLSPAFGLFLLSFPQIEPQGGAGEAVFFPKTAEEVALVGLSQA
jgi:hypothetical protein